MALYRHQVKALTKASSRTKSIATPAAGPEVVREARELVERGLVDPADLFAGRLALKIDEAAGCLGLSESKVRELIREGELSSFRAGRAIRIPVAAITAWIADGGSMPEREEIPGPMSAFTVRRLQKQRTERVSWMER